MSDAYDCLLTIAVPAAFEEDLLDLLRARSEWVSGFSVLSADGFGAGARELSTIEQVLGRSRRRLVQVLMHSEHSQLLREAIGARFQSADMAWWQSPISGFGRFA